MRLTVYCARCLKGNRIVPPKPVVTCRACGNDMPLSGSETLERGRPVERCVLCGRKEFYVESDFPARIGCAVVIVCIVAFLITENLWILIGAALVNFALMVVLSALYWRPGSIHLRALVVGHIAAQCVFTVGAHLRELRESSPGPARSATFLVGALLIGVALVYSTRLFGDPAATGRDMYVRFLVFYGLIFPAYVLLFIGPRRTLGLDRRRIACLAAVVALLLPAYELGFLHGMAWLLVLPIAAAAGWLGRRRA